MKIYRQIKKWQHYQESTVFHVFVDLFLSASTEDVWHKGMEIKVGELFTSVSDIHESTGLDAKTIRKALEKLESSGEISRETSNLGSKITITNFSKFQLGKISTTKSPAKNVGSGNPPQPTPQPTPQQDKNIENKEEFEEEREIVVADARARKNEIGFFEIERTDTANFRLICLERGWEEEDYLAAAKVFRLTCEADGIEHESESEWTNHFRNWCNLHYKYGEKPLKSENEKSAAVQKNCFDEIFAEFYCEKFGTEYIFRKSDQKAISSLLEKIVLKMQEQNAEINLTEKQNALRAFLLKSYDKADKWLKDNFTPIILDKKFNEIYGKLKSNTTAAGNSLSYIERIASELAGIQP